jgi:DNA-binding MarR family transcriptional regulator
MTPRQQQIYDYIKKHPTKTQAELAREFKMTNQGMSKYIKKFNLKYISKWEGF